jgi:hypothetical protein
MAVGLTANLTYRPNIVEIVWANLTASENGDAAEYPEHGDKTVSITGTFGGAITIEGSNDGTTWVGLKDAQSGSAISATSNGIFVIKENTKFIRPVAAAGVAGVKIVVIGRKGAR